MEESSSNAIQVEPLIPASSNLPEITIKVIVFSILLAAVLAAADAYLALKIGTTIAASIPASVLAMGILRFFKQSNVLESNLIQTAASAGEGVSAAMAYVLPALVITQVWMGFPYWQTVAITVTGGILGVLFSIPLRRILFSIPTLRFPEGTAIGSVLKVSATGGAQLKFLARGAGIGGLISFLQTGLKVVGDSLEAWVITSRTVFGFAIGLEPALIAAGYIIGFQVGIAILAGLVVGWVVLLPALAFIYGVPAADSALDAVMIIWNSYLRYIGVGVLLVGGVWTLITLLKPVINGFKESMAASRANRSPGDRSNKIIRTERDIPFNWMILITLIVSIFTFILIYHSILAVGLHYSHYYLLLVTFAATMFILIIGFILGALCGYFAGLIGSTNSPLSGLIIISILLLGGFFLIFFPAKSGAEIAKLTTILLIITAVVTTIPSVSLENIQDLKAGQIVGATPWKQQVILILGVVVSALVIAPVLNLLFQAYGMGGVFPREGMDPSQMLPAPQAGLMATIARGVLSHDINWLMVNIGGVIAILGIIIDEFLKRKHKRFVVLAMGLAIYLPFSISAPLFLGTFISHLAKRRLKKDNKREGQSGILLACGLVAGSALMGVFLAVPFVIYGNSNALSIVSAGFKPIAVFLGVIITAALCYWIYRTASLEKV